MAEEENKYTGFTLLGLGRGMSRKSKGIPETFVPDDGDENVRLTSIGVILDNGRRIIIRIKGNVLHLEHPDVGVLISLPTGAHNTAEILVVNSVKELKELPSARS